MEGIQTDIQTSIWLPEYYLGCQKNRLPNTEYYLEYRILFGIEIIRIPNTNTTIQSNYFNSILIPNYSSHPELTAWEPKIIHLFRTVIIYSQLWWTSPMQNLIGSANTRRPKKTNIGLCEEIIMSVESGPPSLDIYQC